MSDEEFLKRWSRRKQEAKVAEQAPSPPGQTAAASPETAEAASEPEIDLSKLPSIDSITAATDITEFLRKGIPAELSRAALRRAWAADPKIRDFVGLSENAWDFNASGGVAGFGPLEMTDQLRAEMMRMVGQSLEGAADQSGSPEREAQLLRPDLPTGSAGAAEVQRAELATPAEAAPEQEPQQRSERHDAAAVSQRNESDVAPQPDPGNHDDDQLIAKRLHGRALPQ